MTITIEQVKKVFWGLLDNTISREDAEKWAFELQQEEDHKRLVYLPADKEEIIWAALLFIGLYGLKCGIDAYVYGREDLKIFIRDHFNHA